MQLFIITLVLVFTAIFVESLMLILQYRKKKVTEFFGTKDFTVHSILTVGLWAAMIISFIFLQFEKHPRFHDAAILTVLGGGVFAAGLVVSGWGFVLMGLKRSLAINFYRKNIPVERRGIYKYLRNPETAGLCWAVVGFAFMTGSLYNLIIALELIAVMIPHTALENLTLRNLF